MDAPKFAILEQDVPKSGPGGIGHAQIAILEDAIDEDDPWNLRGRQVATDKAAVFVFAPIKGVIDVVEGSVCEYLVHDTNLVKKVLLCEWYNSFL